MGEAAGPVPSAPLSAGTGHPGGTGLGAARPAALAEAVRTAAETLLSGADAAFAGQWEDEDRVVVLAELDRVSELVGVYRGRVLAAHRAQGRWVSLASGMGPPCCQQLGTTSGC